MSAPEDDPHTEDVGELRALGMVMQHSPLLRTLVDLIEGLVLIVGPDRRVVAASDRAVAALGAPSEQAVLGKRTGDLFHCAHVSDGLDGCGTGAACRHCGAFDAITRARRGPQRVDTEVVFAVRDASGAERTEKLRLRAMRASGAEGLTVLVFADREPSDGGWPSSLTSFVRLRTLGQGGMGRVYLVTDLRGSRFALKVLRPEMLAEPGVADRFKREARISLQLRHRNIVRTLEADTASDGTWYLVSEFVPGGSARRFVQQHGTLDARRAVRWMLDVARGLDHAWTAHGVVHRDVKPDNLLVDARGGLKLADFGLAVDAGGRAMRLTQMGHVLGSVHYMPPERTKDAPIDPRSDLYALGATFHRLLTGRHVFEARIPAAVIRKHIQEPPPPLRSRRRALPESLGRCVDGLLHKDMDARPPDAAALVAELLDIAAQLGVDPDGPPPPVPVHSEPDHEAPTQVR